MARTKVKLQLFARESDRRISYRKRKTGMMKKLTELTTLCGVDACAIIASPFEANIQIWPSHDGIQKVLTRLREMPEAEQISKMFNQETFIRDRIRKLHKQLRKLSMENQREETDQIIHKCLAGENVPSEKILQHLNNMDSILYGKIHEINMRIQSVKGETSYQHIPTSGVQIAGSSSLWNPTLGNITNVPNFISNDGGEVSLFSNVGSPRFI